MRCACPSIYARCVAVLTALVAFGGAVPGAHAALRLGVGDQVLQDPGSGPTWTARAARVGATSVRVVATWREIAPIRRPAGFLASDPASRGYRWGRIDATVARLRARGIGVLMLVNSAPDWAEGAGRPADVEPGAWRPDAAALADFVGAMARRYRGRVEAYEIWNEPNLSPFLAPQWTRRGQGWTPTGPGLYRAMLNAAYPAIKAADPGALVVAGGTGPYGEPQPGGARMQPVRFARLLYARPVTADVVSHHPYGVGSPYGRAASPDDVTLGDLRRLVRVWRSAEDRGTLRPRVRHPMWATELGWESRPDPGAVSTATQARWLSDGASVLEAAGFTRAWWFGLRDDAPTPDWRRSAQSGLFRRSGTPKAAATAFGFPFTQRAGGSRSRLYLLPPRSGTCVVRAAWTVVARVRCTAGVGRRLSIARRPGRRLQAQLGRVRSVTTTER